MANYHPLLEVFKAAATCAGCFTHDFSPDGRMLPFMADRGQIMERLLDGRTAIITGSGRGIGRAAAELFARHGARVVVSDIDPAPAEQAVEAILAAGGAGLSVPGDVTDRDFAGRIVGAAIEKFGRLDIIVNNA